MRTRYLNVEHLLREHKPGGRSFIGRRGLNLSGMRAGGRPILTAGRAVRLEAIFTGPAIHSVPPIFIVLRFAAWLSEITTAMLVTPTSAIAINILMQFRI
jgi:hypothetical protein